MSSIGTGPNQIPVNGMLGSMAFQDAESVNIEAGMIGTKTVAALNAAASDQREWSAETVTQTEAEAGTGTTRRAWTAQRVFQAVAAWWAASADKTKLDGIQAGAQVNVGTNLAQGTRTTTAVPVTSSTGTGATLGAATTSLAGVMTAADKTKLDGVATGATANASDAQLRDRATHTGSQAISTVSGLQSALDTKAALNNTVLQYGGATKFQTTSAGVSITGTFSATSDRRFKSNIRPHDAASAWARLGRLRTCAFFYDLIGTDYTGWIAQEVQPIYPHSVAEVGGEEGTHLTLSRDEIIADLVAVVQDQQRRIAQLESGHDAAK